MWHLSALLLILLARAAAGDVVGPEPAELRSRIESYVTQRLATERIPGAAVALVYRGETAMLRGWGLADVEGSIPVDPERTVFRVGSISKALTSTAALGLVRDGLLTLDEDLRPRFRSLPLRPDWPEPLTLHHLLTYTGGFDEVLFGQHTRRPELWLGLEAFLLKTLPPRFERPGRVISYNDYQTCLVGLLVEREDGHDFAVAMGRRVLAPLRMGRSTFDQIVLDAELEAALAAAYEEPFRTLRRVRRDYVMSTPAAGLQTTAADMALYLHAILGSHPQREAVLPEALWKAQISRRFANHPWLQAWGYGFAEDRRNGWTTWFKDGQASGFSARLLVVPELELGVFSVINRSIIRRLGVFDRCASFHRGLSSHLLEAFPPPATAEPQGLPPPPRDASPRRRLYSGVFRYAVASRHTPERLMTWNDDLRVEVADDGRVVVGGAPMVEVEEGVVRHAGESEMLVAFAQPRGGRYRYLFVNRSTYERVPWWGWSALTPWFASSFVALAALAALAGFVTALWGRRRRRDALLPSLLCIAGALRLFAFGGFVAVLGTSDPHGLFSGLPRSLAVFSWLPVAALMPAVTAGALALRRLSAQPRGAVMVCLYLVLTAPEYLWLWHWRLLAWIP